MSRDSDDRAHDRVAPQAGGTGTPIAGSKDGRGEQDQAMSEDAGRIAGDQSEEASNRQSDDGPDDEAHGRLSGSRTDVPGYGSPS